MSNEIYEYMVKKFGIMSVLDLKIKWRDVYKWLGQYPWCSRSFDVVASYLAQKGMSNVWQQ